MDPNEFSLSSTASALTTEDQDSHLVRSESAEPLKRSRACDTDDVKDANLRPRKRAVAATLERPEEHLYCLEGDIDTIQADDNDALPTENDAAMVDYSIGNDSSTEEPEAEGILDIQGDTCFGMICNAKAALLDHSQSKDIQSGINNKHNLSPNPEVIQRFVLSSRQQCYCLQSSDGKDFAVLHSHTATALQALQDLPSIRFEAVLDCGGLNGQDKQYKKGNKTVFSTSVVVYGSERIASQVGKRLSKAHTYLQHPTSLDSNIPYNNPHYYDIPGVPKAESTYIAPISERENQKNPGMDIAKVFEEIDNTRRLSSLNADRHIRTPLLQHQGEGLYFIVQREAAVIDDNFSLWKAHVSESGNHHYQHAIFGSKILERPSSTKGGILADDMGLGKTLTMISAITKTLGESRAFMHSQDHVDTSNSPLSFRKASATLVVAPSAVLLDGWQNEIQRHVTPGTVKVYKYHGIRKVIDLDALIEHDLVMTTYATLTSDFARRISLLQRIVWFRVVLDEAHAVRHQSTQQFRAVCSLHAERRWCITGTPIQNRLEDLGSLIQFLRFDPFDNSAIFRQHISEPLLTNTKMGDQNLRLLLGSMCLRRTRTLLDIPKADDQTVVLSLSPEERIMYSQIIDDTARKIDDCISSRSITKAYSGIFQTILRLRMLCNNGTQQISDSRSEVESCFTKDAMTEGGIVTCSVCSCEINLSDGQDELSPGASPHNSTRLLCPACLSPIDIDNSEDWEKLQRQRSANDRRVQNINTITQSSPRSYSRDRAFSISSRSDRSLRGHSSKLSALISNVQEQMTSNKSIVFSCWKTTLNLLELMLENAEIPYARIDGATSTVERNRIVKQFQENPDTKLLLMTTGTGAVGLNLTTATRVHLLEPQWNPAIEAQAVGRAVRLGQKRTVTIIRYVMAKTIEQSIQSRQIMKLQLAELTLEKKDGNEQTIMQRLKDLRSLLHKY